VERGWICCDWEPRRDWKYIPSRDVLHFSCPADQCGWRVRKGWFWNDSQRLRGERRTQYANHVRGFTPEIQWMNECIHEIIANLSSAVYMPVVMKFCFKNNIILCCLPFYTSQKLQLLDVGVFGLLKAAYREQVARLCRDGARTIGKEHFTTLYSCACKILFTA